MVRGGEREGKEDGSGCLSGGKKAKMADLGSQPLDVLPFLPPPASCWPLCRPRKPAAHETDKTITHFFFLRQFLLLLLLSMCLGGGWFGGVTYIWGPLLFPLESNTQKPFLCVRVVYPSSRRLVSLKARCRVPFPVGFSFFVLCFDGNVIFSFCFWQTNLIYLFIYLYIRGVLGKYIYHRETKYRYLYLCKGTHTGTELRQTCTI